jgi:hypothetical protein
MKKLLLISIISFFSGCTIQASSIHSIATIGDINRLNAYIHAGSNIEALNAQGNTPLHLAAFFGHVNIVKALIGAGANVNASGHCAYTPLHLATKKRHRNVLTALLLGGANMKALDQHGNTALNIANNQGYFDLQPLFRIASAEQTLFCEIILKAYNEYAEGRKELLARVLGGTKKEDQLKIPDSVIKRVRMLFPQAHLSNDILFKLLLPGVKIETPLEIEQREHDFLERAKNRSRVSSDMKIDDK